MDRQPAENMQKRFLSLWLPRFATDLILRAQPALAGLPLVLTTAQRGRLTVSALSAEAEAEGMFTGMPLADARAIVPSVMVQDDAPAQQARSLARLADWADRYTPSVALDPPDGLMLDITGCAHLFAGPEDDGESAMVADLSDRLGDFNTRLAIADCAAAAWAWARYRPDEQGAILPPGSQRQLLAGLPVAALRLDARIVDDLVRLGLRRIGDLYPLPRADLQRRFGAALLDRLDRMLGRSADPIVPRRPAPRFSERQGFAEPITEQEDIAASVQMMLDRLCVAMTEAGLGAKRLQLSLYGESRHAGEASNTSRLCWGSGRPSQDSEHLAGLFVEKLARAELTISVDLMVLEVVETDSISAAQLAAFESQAGSGDFSALIDRIQARLGDDSVISLRPRQSHLPEQAVTLSDDAASDDHWPEHWPEHWQRPLCLLPEPEPVAMTLTDDRPAAFIWRGRRFVIRRTDGPERIAPEWWRSRRAFEDPATMTRDYYRIEDKTGRRFWLLHHRATRHWDIHGFIA